MNIRFLLLLLTFAGLSTQTWAQKFQNDYKFILTQINLQDKPADKITMIDDTLNKWVRGKLKAGPDQIKDLMSLRQSFCASARKACFNLANAGSVMCGESGISDSNQDQWNAIVKQVQNEAEAKELANNIQSCSKEPTREKLAGALALHGAAYGKYAAATKILSSWVSKDYSASAQAMQTAITEIDAHLVAMETKRPVPLAAMEDVTMWTIPWASSKAAAEINDKSKRDWVEFLGKYLIIGGGSKEYDQVAGKMPIKKLSDGNFDWAARTLQRLCTYWRTVGKTADCNKLAEELKAEAVAEKDQVGQMRVEFERAKDLLEMGKGGEAEAIQTRILQQADSMKIPGMSTWLQFNLARTKLALGKPSEARSLIDAHLKSLSEMSGVPPWLKAYGRVVLVEILIEQKKYAEARKEAEDTRAMLSKEITGVPDILAFLDLDRMLIAAGEGKKDEVTKIGGELTNSLRELPALGYIAQFRDAITNSVNGKDYKSFLQSTRKELGQTNSLPLRIEKTIARISSPASAN
jgi:hypothetical protein